MKTFDIVSDAVKYMLLRGLICGALLGAIYGTLIIPIIGTAYGVIFGAVAGVVLGLVLGLIVGLVSAKFFNPVTNPRPFQIIIIIVSGLIVFSGGVFGAVMLYGIRDPIAPLIPALIATGSAMYVGYRYTRRYVAGQAEPVAQQGV